MYSIDICEDLSTHKLKSRLCALVLFCAISSLILKKCYWLPEKHITTFIIQRIDTLPKYGQKTLNVRRST